MKKPFLENMTLKLIALVLAIITWFYISSEMKRHSAGAGIYTADHK